MFVAPHQRAAKCAPRHRLYREPRHRLQSLLRWLLLYVLIIVVVVLALWGYQVIGEWIASWGDNGAIPLGT